MNNISITLSADASATVIERAHATIDAFFGRITNATLAELAPAAAADHVTATIEQHAAPAHSGPVELDADGLPWDERIHASTKTKTQKNQWTKRKGADDATIAHVLAELRSKYPAAEVTLASVPAAVVTTPVVAPAVKIAPKTKYQELCNFLAEHATSETLTQDVVKATFEQNGTTLAKLAGDEAASAAFLEAFTNFLAG